MTEPSDAFAYYRVSYNGVARQSIRNLIQGAQKPEHARLLLDSVKEMDRRLHLYPQFGEPLQKLETVSAELWVAIVAPIVMHYYLNESERLVMVARPVRCLTMR